MCHADGNGLYRSSELAVEYGRNILGFRYGDCFFGEIHPAMLWAKETLPALAGLEAWETYSLGVPEEIGICRFKIAE